MTHDYTRPEKLGFTIEDYSKEYKKRYGRHGPSSSSDCCGENVDMAMDCGCWVCQMIKWRKEK